MKDAKEWKTWEEWNFTVTTGLGTRLPSGGMYPPYGHIGHWEVTAKIAEEMGFSSPACDVLCDAAQDPDFYDFLTPAAHAQTPDDADTKPAKRDAIIAQAINDYVVWIGDLFNKCKGAAAKGDMRLALYWLGYLLHGVEDLAVHKGITNGEHAAASNNPDYSAPDVALSYVYARRMLETVRNALGQVAFDSLRNHDGEGRLGPFEKRRKNVHPGGWDMPDGLPGYLLKAGAAYKKITPPPKPVRWDREFVLSRLLEKVQEARRTHMKSAYRAAPDSSPNPQRRFEVVNPIAPQPQAEWLVLVYMAGDDSSPQGIEYAIAQDLAEIKQVGSSDKVHIVAQTDDASGSASYRYRLRKGTDLEADRIERFDGDLNTGSTKTLVDFVQWAHHLFPATHIALVLWGHGSGHDDQNVYRALRGSVGPRTAARLARKRLGFFSGTRRAILEQGPTRGYGYDDTAGDFLDNGELRKALLEIKDIISKEIDLLGFDACLMAMVEVAYQVADTAKIIVASERSEPGDGWAYSDSLRALSRNPQRTPRQLAGDIVAAYRKAYNDEMTLSAADLKMISQLKDDIGVWAKAAEPADFHLFRRAALDCSPRAGDGYCDLSSFLQAASGRRITGEKEAKTALATLKKTVIASCGKAGGLTIYAPGNFRPQQAGSTDALYMSLLFARESGWADLLGRVYPPLAKAAPGIDNLPIPTPVSGLDRFNARRVLAAARSKARESWVDRLRSDLLTPCEDAIESVEKWLDKVEPPRDPESPPPSEKPGPSPEEQRRILILPGIAASLLHDRSGKLGGVWVDPWNLIFGSDFEALKLRWETDGGGAKGAARLLPPAHPVPLDERIPDADAAVRIEAYGALPLLYDRLALALMHSFGPVVEYAPFDWRQPIAYLGRGLATRIEALAARCPGIEIALVAHSMGGLVAADALSRLEAAKAPALQSVKAFVALGAPFLGSSGSFKALRAERTDLNLLKFLGGKSTEEIESTVQTFRGLFDMLPANQAELRRPQLFAPGPLSRLSPDDIRLTSFPGFGRGLSPAMMKKSRAVVCTAFRTTDRVIIRGDGTADYSDIVGGDGTVPPTSSLIGDSLRPTCCEVHERHMTLPLDGNAITHTIDWIATQFAPPPAAAASLSWPEAPPADLPKSEAELVRHLEADDQFTLGDFLALLTLI